jgi:2-dehydropantoate 2-reductase
MQTLVYGGGAVGLGLASCLLKAGEWVTILARPETARSLHQEGLTRTGIFGEAFAPGDQFDVVTSLEDLPAASFDTILVCVKSFDSERAARDLYEQRRVLQTDSTIVLCQNGWGNAQTFVRVFPSEAVYNARVITGFTRPALNHVRVTVHASAIHVGSLFGGQLDRVASLCEAVTAGDIPCKAVPEIEKDLWAKMLFNCSLNPVGAVFGVTYGELGESEAARQIMKRVIGEIFQVMEAAGYVTHWSSAQNYLRDFYGTLIPLTADHYPSTLQDLRAGKRTEIDALNGVVVALGKQHGVPVPANDVLYQMVKFLERQASG